MATGAFRMRTPTATESRPATARAGGAACRAGREYLFTADGMREALKGFDFKRALDILEAAGALPPAGRTASGPVSIASPGGPCGCIASDPTSLVATMGIEALFETLRRRDGADPSATR